MATTRSSNPHYKKLLFVLVAFAIMIGAAYGTIYLLKQFSPLKTPNAPSETTAAGATLDKAEQLFAKGDYQAAKTEYKKVLSSYQAQNNEAGAADIEMQIRVIDASAAAAEPTPENTDKEKISSGGQAE